MTRRLILLSGFGLILLACTNDPNDRISSLEGQLDSLASQVAEMQEQWQASIDDDIARAAEMLFERVSIYETIGISLGTNIGALVSDSQIIENILGACSNLADLDIRSSSVRMDEIPEEFRVFALDFNCQAVTETINAVDMDLDRWAALDTAIGGGVRDAVARIPDWSVAQLAHVMQDRRDGVLNR